MSERKIVRIWFKDGGYKSFPVTKDETMADLFEKVAVKLNMKEFQQHFSLREIKGKNSDRLVDVDEKPYDIKTQWEEEGYQIENGYYKLSFELRTDSQMHVERRMSKRYMLKAGEHNHALGLGRTGDEAAVLGGESGSGSSSSSSSEGDETQEGDEGVEQLLDTLEMMSNKNIGTVAAVLGDDGARSVRSGSVRGNQAGSSSSGNTEGSSDEQDDGNGKRVQRVPILEREVLFEDEENGMTPLDFVLGEIDAMLACV